jgi:hypothetical protein
MKNSIILAFSIIASTIAPIAVVPDVAFAQNGIDLVSCAAMSQEEKAESIAPSTAPIGTAKDLMLGGPQKVNVRCFTSGDGEKVPPMKGPIVIELPKSDQLELLRIRF